MLVKGAPVCHRAFVPVPTIASIVVMQYITKQTTIQVFPDSKVHGANMGPIWDRQDPGGPHVGHINLAIWVGISYIKP